jgi:CheY-like chemotaxis protein
VARVNELLTRLIGEDVELIAELAPSVHPIEADAGQLEQVIVNLAVNARDAMPAGGRLIIATANIEAGAVDAEHLPDLKPCDHVMLSVSDSGEGMTPETLHQIFEPFFTTKEEGKGTGLGLATAFGIVKQSGGDIRVESEPGVGTRFEIYLPRAEAPVVRLAPAAPVPRAPSGTETILLVEDEEQVRRLVGNALRSFGYAVLEAAHGEEALELAEATAHIDLLLTDIVMPGLNGHELAQRLVDSRPGLRVLFTSGYPADAALREGIAAARAAYLEKPYLPDELARKIRFVLDGQGLDDALGAPTSLSSD